MLLIGQNKDLCCGCRACQQICPTDAITMQPDDTGFLYPVVNADKCIECRKCEKTCDFLNVKPRQNEKMPLKTYVAFHKNEDVRSNSMSGGVFTAVSDIIIENNGVVYGADFNADFSVSHKRAETCVQRDRFRKSKYVQSDTEQTFTDVYNDLKNGKDVLYSGTSCQIAALLSFLKNKGITVPSDKLTTIDIVCHGVVSPKVWKDNLSDILTKNNGKSITAVRFRDKSFGWDSNIESYIIDGKKVLSTDYTDIFYSCKALRPSCFSCPYASTQKVGDITLADAWGIKKNKPQWEFEKGVSLTFANTEKGLKILEDIASVMEMSEVRLADYMQPNLKAPTPKPAGQERFWSDYNAKGYRFVAKQCKKEQAAVKRRNLFKKNVVRVLRALHLRK